MGCSLVLTIIPTTLNTTNIIHLISLTSKADAVQLLYFIINSDVDVMHSIILFIDTIFECILSITLPTVLCMYWLLSTWIIEYFHRMIIFLLSIKNIWNCQKQTITTKILYFYMIYRHTVVNMINTDFEQTKF